MSREYPGPELIWCCTVPGHPFPYFEPTRSRVIDEMIRGETGEILTDDPRRRRNVWRRFKRMGYRCRPLLVRERGT